MWYIHIVQYVSIADYTILLLAVHFFTYFCEKVKCLYSDSKVHYPLVICYSLLRQIIERIKIAKTRSSTNVDHSKAPRVKLTYNGADVAKHFCSHPAFH